MAGEPTFAPPHAPSLPFTDEREPRVLATEYGDGYIERAGDGINTDPRVLRLRWQVLSGAEKDEIFNFLAARKGYEAFLWTPPDDVERKFVCPRYSREKLDADIWEVSAEFREVFDP